MSGIQKHAAATNIEVVAVADTWSQAREKAKARAKEWFGSDAKAFSSYRDVLAMKDVDAVMIASPTICTRCTSRRPPTRGSTSTWRSRWRRSSTSS